uniref:Uncharacterized protein n=1 Tax=Setaria viridis TaxID=4556 RepID=A0A4U6UK70_SETVI|nr:hypothetical protein SEVIR_5G311850v2 [Setaria viridis]
MMNLWAVVRAWSIHPLSLVLLHQTGSKEAKSMFPFYTSTSRKGNDR